MGLPADRALEIRPSPKPARKDSFQGYRSPEGPIGLVVAVVGFNTGPPGVYKALLRWLADLSTSIYHNDLQR